MTDLPRHQIPPGGWQYYQPQTGWRAPTPINSTFDQTVVLIIKHRMANPAIVGKYNLETDFQVVANELEDFNRLRLKLPGRNEFPKPQPLSAFAKPPGVKEVVAADNRSSLAFGIKRAAQGAAVVLDWLTSGGKPVERELAESRAKVCMTCSMNVPGAWYTESPAAIIQATLNARPDVKLETQYDADLKSCDVCRCLNRLKIWCPIEHILKQTKPEIMAEFPAHCWIAKERK